MLTSLDWDAFSTYNELSELLTQYDQMHLLEFWPTLEPSQQQALSTQLQSFDFSIFAEQSRILGVNDPVSSEFTSFDEAKALPETVPDEFPAHLFATLLVAGGQGSRLGSSNPKGMYPVTALSQKSLFQRVAERTVAASKAWKTPLNLIIMLSKQTEIATLDFFAEYDNFGLEEGQLHFFCQTYLPLLDDAGHMFLDRPWRVASGPDGNGGALHRLYESGIWKSLYDSGVRHLFFSIVDNALADPFDWDFGKSHLASGAEVSAKAVLKERPEEKLGLFVRAEHGVRVVEYSELQDSDLSALDSSGNLQYRCGNMSLFCFDMNFVKVVAASQKLPLHKAWKRVETLDADGSVIASMAWKFETFIFDALELAKQVAILTCPRGRCFAPLKDPSGEYGPEGVQKALLKDDARRYKQIFARSPKGDLELDAGYYYPTEEVLSTLRLFTPPDCGLVPFPEF